MTSEKAAKQAAKVLMLAFKTMRPSDEAGDINVLQPHGYRRAPSGRRFLLDATCRDAIEKATQKLRSVSSGYPEDLCRTRLTNIVVGAIDQGIPIENAFDHMRNEILSVLRELSEEMGDWEVIHAVRGVQMECRPFTVGRCTFYQMDKQAFLRWGQRHATGKYYPPVDAPVHQDWIEQEQVLVGQGIAAARISAVDSGQARFEARRVIEEALDLLRYGQLVVGWHPRPFPEIGLAALSSHGYVHDHSASIRLDKLDFATNKAISSGDGAIISYCKDAPAWDELEKLLRIPPDQRNEMQCRVILALSWVGQAALASSQPVRIVMLTTALETLLIEDFESLGKKAKLAERISRFPKLQQACGHVGTKEAKRLYEIRSGCLHAGRMDVPDGKVQLTNMAIAQCLSGILSDPVLRSKSTLSGVLGVLCQRPEQRSLARWLSVVIKFLRNLFRQVAGFVTSGGSRH